MVTVRTSARILAILLATALAGCSGAASSPRETAAPSISGRPAPSAAADIASTPAGVGWEADSAAAMDELMAAIGNPDVGSTSDAFEAFEAALATPDPAAIRATAEVVLGHLERARALLAPYVGADDVGASAGEWDALMVGITDGVAEMRDGGVGGSPTAVEAGRARMTDALRDHFYQAAYGPSSDRWHVSWPWPDTRSVTPSRSRLGNEAGLAFDGQADTFWTAGDAPAPQWIQVDLGRVVTITGVRLLTAQPVAGTTDHRVTIEGPTLESRELVAFQDATGDRQWLEYTAPQAIPGVQVVRVTTLASPGMIGWREIEPVLAPEFQAQACPGGTTNVALDRPATAPSSPGSKPALAVDGDTQTTWDAGAPAPQSIELDLGRETSISSVRLLPATPPDAPIAVVIRARDEADHTMVLGVINQAQTGSGWLTVPGPTPCVGLRWVSIETGSSVGSVGWREIEVLGTAPP